jgi:hypothetical protein
MAVTVEPKIRLHAHLFQCPTPSRRAKSRLRRQALCQDPGETVTQARALGTFR